MSYILILLLLLSIIVLILVIKPLFIKHENFVSDTSDIAWYQGTNEKHYIHDGGQIDDTHEFNKSGMYKKDLGSEEYVKCRNNGFTKEFCLETPIANNNPNTCVCENGQMGYFKTGFKGECICNHMVSNQTVSNQIYDDTAPSANYL